MKRLKADKIFFMIFRFKPFTFLYWLWPYVFAFLRAGGQDLLNKTDSVDTVGLNTFVITSKLCLNYDIITFYLNIFI